MLETQRLLLREMDQDDFEALLSESGSPMIPEDQYAAIVNGRG